MSERLLKRTSLEGTGSVLPSEEQRGHNVMRPTFTSADMYSGTNAAVYSGTSEARYSGTNADSYSGTSAARK